MAQVLLCRDEHLGRLVAVKRLHADSPDDVERRFAREARLGAALNHPNLVSVFDTAVDEDGVLIVMEYVEGQALSRALRRGPLEPGRVARMARDLGGALDHAHAHNVIHRDVKPGNVLLREDGISKLADLGIATAVDLTRITRSGELLGTAAYMAPEQLEGHEPRPASDVYALAAVCFEALAGVRPRSGRSAIELAHRIATEPPPDLRDRLPSAPAAAAAALRRGMAHDPDERSASAGELAGELAAALEGREAPPPPAAAPTRRLPRADPIAVPPVRGVARRAEPPNAAPLPSSVPKSVRAAAPPEPRAPARTAAPAPSPVAPSPRRRSRGRPAALIPIALLALVAAAVAGVFLSGGGGSTPDREQPQQQARENAPAKQGDGHKAKQHKGKQHKAGAKSKPVEEATPPAPPAAEPAPTEPAATADPARGAQLNDQGYALMQRGDFAAAIPILQQAVASWPRGSQDINLAYALYNLGRALNRGGRPTEAIPYLERRLGWPDQRATVQAELDLARQNAGQG
jgi:serine/threonine-protein kinase